LSDERANPPQRVPILTEVVQLSQSGSVDIPIDGPSDEPQPGIESTRGGAGPAQSPDLIPGPAPLAAHVPAELEQELVERIWVDVQRQVELMFEYRMREALSPILSRATDAVLRETRQQLASTLREVVAKAVAQELARHRGS